MRVILTTILSLLLLTTPLFGQETGVLYQYETSSGIKWKTFGDGKVQPVYKGEIKNGKMDGLGVLIFPYNGQSVVGEWKNGKEWNTKHTKNDGTLLGKFENGEWISWGVLYFKYRNEEFRFYTEKWEGVVSKDYIYEGKYEGEIKNGIPNGQGTITSPDGEKYVGGWKNGKINGQGTTTFPDEGKDVGEWKENKPWNITQYDKNGNIIGRFVNGKYIKP